MNNKGYVYVLLLDNGSLYIGSTRDLSGRLKYHQSNKVKTTKRSKTKKLIYKREYSTYREAKKAELKFKSGSGREWIKKNILNKI